MTPLSFPGYARVVVKELQHASAFVVQFRTAENPEGKLSGRIEHVASGITATFHSVDDLPALFLQVLREVEAQSKKKASAIGGGQP